MAGQIKKMLDAIIEQRAKGNAVVIQTTQAKLIFKGLDPKKFTSASPDDAAVIEKIKAVAAELGVSV